MTIQSRPRAGKNLTPQWARKINMTDYSATMAFGLSLTVTPYPGGVAGTPYTAGTAIKQVVPPQKKAPITKFTPLNGTQAGVEMGIAGKVELTEATVKLVYTDTEYTAWLALFRSGANQLNLNYRLTLASGAIISVGDATNGWSQLTNVSIGTLDDTNEQTIDLTFTVPGGWTPTMGKVFTAFVTVGTTVDLTASPYLATGMFVRQIAAIGTTGNAAVVTITPGAAMLGAAGILEVGAGQSGHLSASTPHVIDSTVADKDIVVSGTGTDSVTLNLLLSAS